MGEQVQTSEKTRKEVWDAVSVSSRGKRPVTVAGRGDVPLAMEPKDEAGGASFLKQQLWVRKTMALTVTLGVAPCGSPFFLRRYRGI